MNEALHRVPIPNEAGWVAQPLESLCDLISRGTAPSYVDASDVTAIGQRCVTNDRFDASAGRPHSARAMHRMLTPTVGDVLLNSTGTGTIGRSCLFDERGSFIVDGHVTVLRPKRSVTDGRWLTAVIRSPWGQSFLETKCFSGSTNQIELARTPLSLAELPAPPLPEQRAIAAVLDTIDDAIRKTEQIIAKLQQVKQGLLHDLLTRGIDDNGELRDPERHPEQFQDSPLGRIPKGWTVKPLSEVAAAPICYGIVQPGPFTAGGPFVLTIGDLRGDFRTGLHQASRSVELPYARSRTQGGDVLLSIKGTIGRIAVAPGWYSGNISRDVARVRLGAAALPHFVRQFLLSPFGQRRLDLSVVGTTRAEISIHVLKRFLVPLAAVGEQAEIAGRLVNADARVESERAGVEKLRSLKSGLAEDLLTGRVRTTSLAEVAA